MKILFCTNTFENVQNGPSKFANHLLEINQRFEGIEIRILTEDISTSRLDSYKGQVIRVDPKINPLTRPWGFLYRMFPYYRACASLRAEYPYDIVIFNNAITGIWAARKLPVPVIGMINDYTSLTHSWVSFDASWQWFRRFIFKWSERLACSVEDGILVNSEYLFNQVKATYGVPSAKLRIVYKGLKVYPMPIRSPIPSQSSIKVLFVKSDYKLGGLYDVINALSSIAERTFELYVVGPALRFKEDIVKATTSTHVQIRFVGPATQQEVYGYMQHCDLFVVPSYKEALGVANLEALMNGIPVITSQVGGIPETMDHGTNGWMVPPGQVDKLADTIRHVIANPAERQEKQQKGYDYVSRKFAFEKVLERFVEVLQQYHEDYFRIK
ncbi:glycosyltransferase family 4 protein [Telluribacter sp. SYSU D00476]|uniref:glycosyltransferase family 4 protein n=1 Tax=Telluribacter sp. SYSU D00476 TaxID=2811430 RepID=UPI001FF4DB56|nr:glycosyltransferase family 4 protein [Telluribacter sp. SYSU D00476]